MAPYPCALENTVRKEPWHSLECFHIKAAVLQCSVNVLVLIDREEVGENVILTCNTATF